MTRTPCPWSRIGLVAAAVALAGVAVLAQRGAAPTQGGGRESRPPNPLGQPLLDAAGHPRDDVFIRIPLRPEDRKYAISTGRA